MTYNISEYQAVAAHILKHVALAILFLLDGAAVFSLIAGWCIACQGEMDGVTLLVGGAVWLPVSLWLNVNLELAQ